MGKWDILNFKNSGKKISIMKGGILRTKKSKKKNLLAYKCHRNSGTHVVTLALKFPEGRRFPGALPMTCTTFMALTCASLARSRSPESN
jgi:hypothetical protein